MMRSLTDSLRRHARTFLQIPDTPKAATPQKQKEPPPRKEKDQTPTRDEIIGAIDGAGYPLEIRVYEELRAAQFSLIPSFRVQQRDDSLDTKEIDLFASRDVIHTWETRAKIALVQIEALIQMKKIRFGGLVGFLAPVTPSRDALRLDRVPSIPGLPSYNVLSGEQYRSHEELLLGRDALASALDGIDAGPYCMHWAQYGRDKSGTVQIEQENRTWEAIASTLRAMTWRANDLTRVAHSGDLGSVAVALHLQIPTVVVDAPLWTYNVQTAALTEADGFTTNVAVDTFRGVADVLVDVVAATKLDGFIARYNDAAQRAKHVLERHGSALATVGEVHLRAARDAEQERTAYRFRPDSADRG